MREKIIVESELERLSDLLENCVVLKDIDGLWALIKKTQFRIKDVDLGMAQIEKAYGFKNAAALGPYVIQRCKLLSFISRATVHISRLSRENLRDKAAARLEA